MEEGSRGARSLKAGHRSATMERMHHPFLEMRVAVLAGNEVRIERRWVNRLHMQTLVPTGPEGFCLRLRELGSPRTASATGRAPVAGFGPFVRLATTPLFILATLVGGHASRGCIGRGDASAHPVSGDSVCGSRVPLESTAETLAKKLGYRMIQNGEIVPRDLYDLSIARWKDPDALHAALAVLSEREFYDIDSGLRNLGPGWMERSRQPDTENALVFVRREIQRHIRSRARGVDCGFAPESESAHA